MASERAAVEPFGIDPDVDHRELVALYGFAFLLTGDRAVAADLAREAGTATGISGEHRKAIVRRARIARRARKARGSGDGPPVVAALTSLAHRERAVLVASLHDHASEAEIASIARCDPSEVASLLDRALAAAGKALGEDPEGAGLPGTLRVGMLAAVDELGEPTWEQWWTRRRPGLRGALLVSVLAGLAAAAITVTGGADEESPAPDAAMFVHDRYGFSLSVAPAWRSISTTARGNLDGVDPATLGLAIEDPSDDPALFIPRRARERPAMLRISVAPSRSFDVDVAALRDRIATLPGDEPAVAPAARDQIASRPAMRFVVEHGEDDPSCPGCFAHTWLAHWMHGTTLTVELRVFGRDVALLEEAILMVRSLQTTAASMRYQPERGSVAAGLVVDEQLETLLQFLDARAMGSEPRVWLDDGATHPGDLFAVATYRVHRRDAGTFDVTIEQRDRLGRSLGSRDETIRVGPGSRSGVPWPAVVLEVAVISRR